MKLGIFREELPGERKSIINLLILGYLVVISILGYMAFYLSIQMGLVDRFVHSVDFNTLSAEEFRLFQEKISTTARRLSNEAIWIAVLGGLFSLIGGIYTFNLVIRPLRQLVAFTERGEGELPEIKANNEIKQLMTAILNNAPPRTAEDKPVETADSQGA